MGKIKKAYVDSKFRTRGSISDSDFKLGIKKHLVYQIIQYVILMT